MKITINDDINNKINIQIINRNNLYYQNIFKKNIYKIVESSDVSYYYKIQFLQSISFILINKGLNHKSRDISLYKSNIYNNNIFFYTYFIHTKYFIKKNKAIYIEKEQSQGSFYQEYMIESITSKKLFNCCDYYRIHSFI